MNGKVTNQWDLVVCFSTLESTVSPSPPPASSCRACFATSGIGGSRRASDRAASEQPPPSESTSASESTLSHALPPSWRRLRSTQQPGCELARQCHGGFLPFFTLPLPPLSVTSNPNGERDIGRCCPGIRSKLYSCLNLLPCTF